MKTFSSLLAAAAIVATVAVSPSAVFAQQAFKSTNEAIDALIVALRAGDSKSINRVLGPNGSQIVSSGDAVQDENTRKIVLAAYDIKHSTARDSLGRTFLTVGENEYPIPLPLVEKDGHWRFDTVAGREEILARRIGRNELGAIQASLAYVDAQHEYAEMAPNGGVGNYAQKIISELGKKDGLYWPSAAGEPQSPLGPVVASATWQGYKVGGGRTPFHGYYYKILTRQGPTAPGGAFNYIANGKMIGGFALVAYPAIYGNSGVKTFLVNHNGEVYEKDLGPQTSRIVARMNAFNPDRTWQKVAVEPK